MTDAPIHALIISPHPADTDFGIAGLATRWLREGKELVYVICTNGDKGSSHAHIPPEKLAEIRKNEQLAAAEVLGIKNIIFLPHADLSLEYTPELKKELLRLVLTYRPTVVATCDPFDHKYISNPDHRTLGRAVMDVVWPMCLAPNSYVDLQAEGLKLHKVQELLLWGPAEPNYYVDITDIFEHKLKAVRCYESQVGPDGNAPDFDQFLTDMATTAGKAIGCKYAEAFHREEVLQRL